MATPHKLRSRGVSLVEAMVALAVMAFGMLTIVGVQSTLRLNGDIAKQRTEATHIAARHMERLHSFTAVDTDGVPSFADITTSTAAPATVMNTGTATSSADYTVETAVVDTADPPAKALRVTVRWTDRAGQGQQVMLSSVLSSAVPALSGTLAIRPGTAPAGPVRRPYRRHQSIPVQARDFGSSSAFVPPGPGPRMAIVFNNITGVVTGVCNVAPDTTNNNVELSDIASCSNNTTGQLLSGFVRFNRNTSPGALTAADVEDPQGQALNLVMLIALTSSGHPNSPICFSEGVNFGQTVVAYFCVIHSNSSGLWSGTTAIEPSGFGSDAWLIGDDPMGTDPQRFRVCRYTTASSDNQTVPNQDHPRNYSDVIGNLTNQNFVVIPARKSCPTDVPANPSAGDFVNSNTLQHQPAPSP
jgi:Tfp pilus assembly protein PilV